MCIRDRVLRVCAALCATTRTALPTPAPVSGNSTTAQCTFSAYPSHFHHLSHNEGSVFWRSVDFDGPPLAARATHGRVPSLRTSRPLETASPVSRFPYD